MRYRLHKSLSLRLAAIEHLFYNGLRISTYGCEPHLQRLMDFCMSSNTHFPKSRRRPVKQANDVADQLALIEIEYQCHKTTGDQTHDE